MNDTGTNGNTTAVECPVCGANISLSLSAEVGELLDCAGCDSELELVALDPIKLEQAPEEEEDWGE